MSGDDGLREAIKVWINATDDDWTGYAPTDPVGARADSLLALPELAALRAKAAAADRVRAIAYEDTWGEVDPLDHRDRILEALDGPPC